MCLKCSSLSRAQLFATPWTAAHQAPLFMGFSRQGYWSGLPCPPPGDLPNRGTELGSPPLQADSLPSEPPGKPIHIYVCVYIHTYIHIYICCSVTKLCLTLCDPMDCNLPGSSVHGILQARLLEWVVMPSSRGSSQPRD